MFRVDDTTPLFRDALVHSREGHISRVSLYLDFAVSNNLCLPSFKYHAYSLHVHANVLQNKNPSIFFLVQVENHARVPTQHPPPHRSPLPRPPRSTAFNDSSSCASQHHLFFRVGEDCAEQAEKRDRWLNRHHSLLPGKPAAAFGPARQPLLGIQTCAQINAPQKRPRKQHATSLFGAAPLATLSVLGTLQCLLGPFENFPLLSPVPRYRLSLA